ncbi:MAG: beta-ketoacyl reductase, partial [bacterium]
FRFMSRSEHIGKIVVNFNNMTVRTKKDKKQRWFKKEGTALITGGTRGFGLALAEHLSVKGIEKLVLVSRSGAKSPEAQKAVEKMRERGTKIDVRALDVTDKNAVGDMIASLKDSGLHSIFHGAMVLDDDRLINLKKENFAKVFGPKVQGVWNLHKALEKEKVTVGNFVMFSSISSLVGNSGQANYVAANAFLDSFASFRRYAGLNAVTVNWGVLADTGVVSRDKDVSAVLENSGIHGLSTSEALEALDKALDTGEEQMGIFDVDWAKWSSMNEVAAGKERFKELVSDAGANNRPEKLQKLVDELVVLEKDERLEKLRDILRKTIAEVMKFPAKKIDVNESINTLGVDSLMITEIISNLQSDYALSVSNMELLNGPSIAELAEKQLGKIISEEDELLGEIDHMDEEEINKLLAS